MHLNESYDVSIVGGGLAGLSAAIQLARKGHSVVLFEKEKYPFHKVCGEYISNESKNYLKELGVDIDEMELPSIDTLLLTSSSGLSIRAKLGLGGFGVSRFLLDKYLADIAVSEGVDLLDQTKVEEVECKDRYHIKFRSPHTSLSSITTKICCGAYGKRSNLDIKWRRDFLKEKQTRLNNYIAVKYHVHTDWKNNVIGLHNFNGGYCGISKIEKDKYCLCYMTKGVALKNSNNDLKKMEEEILFQNPYLKNIFKESSIVEGFPITISQISYAKKEKVENGMLMLGDAAGLITPLCGNGMSIALHSGKLAADLISRVLDEKMSINQMKQRYKLLWDKQFASRFRMGRMLQSFFGSDRLSNSFVRTFQLLPFLSAPVIRKTHGEIF